MDEGRSTPELIEKVVLCRKEMIEACLEQCSYAFEHMKKGLDAVKGSSLLENNENTNEVTNLEGFPFKDEDIPSTEQVDGLLVKTTELKTLLATLERKQNCPISKVVDKI